MPPTIFWNTTAIGRPAAMMVATDARPIENATGTPSSSSSAKLTPRYSQFHAGATSSAQQGDDVFEREQHDQRAGDDQRQVVRTLGHAQHGLLVVPLARGPEPAALGHQDAEQRDQQVDQRCRA